LSGPQDGETVVREPCSNYNLKRGQTNPVGSAKRKSTSGPIGRQSGVSPFAPLEMQIAANRVKGVFFLFDLIRSGVSPGPDDPKAWYDRAIRAIGGVIILLVLFFGLLLLIIDRFRKV
jgi:hypothetical protein